MLAIQEKRINLIHILGIVAIGLILTLRITSGGIFEAMDLVAWHLKWSKHFSEQFWAGDLYPRWLEGMNAGLGSPTFFFYGPIPYYFSSLFDPLFANDPQGWHQLGLSATLALTASGLTAYIWLRSITSKNAAFISSILYMVLPYHLAVDLYCRFALGEFWTFVWIPLILYFSTKLISGHKFSLIGFAVSYALLIMTHLITVLIFSIVPVCYIFFLSVRRQRKKALISLGVATILGIGLSAIYLLPAMTTQKYVSMNTIMEGEFFYGNNFLFEASKFYSSKFYLYIGLQTLLMGGLACCAFFMARIHPVVHCRRESTYWIAIAMVALLMTLPLSRPIWEIFSVLQRIQHPWRFNIVLIVANTALLALAISSLKKPVNLLTNKLFATGTFLVTSLLLSGAIIIYIYTSQALYTYTVLEKPIDVDKTLEISFDAGEYRPKWVPVEIFQPDIIAQLGKSSPKAWVSVGQGNLSIQQWKPRNIVLQTNATTDVVLTFHQFYYPGWKAKLDGKLQLLPVQPSEKEGLLRIEVPSGQHEVRVTLDAGVEERAGQIISAVFALITLFSVFCFRKVGRDLVSFDSRFAKHNETT